MGKALHSRRITWALVLWSAYVVSWTMITGSGQTLFTLWWLAGAIVLVGSFRVAAPLFRPGRTSHHDLEGLIVSSEVPARIGDRGPTGAIALGSWEDEGGATLSPARP
jgi:hypothetical protein